MGVPRDGDAAGTQGEYSESAHPTSRNAGHPLRPAKTFRTEPTSKRGKVLVARSRGWEMWAVKRSVPQECLFSALFPFFRQSRDSA